MTSRSQMFTGGLGLGLIALLGGACTTVVVEPGPGGSGGGGGCPDTAHCVTCPPSEPHEGEPCNLVGMSCTYPVATDCAKSDDIATCAPNGAWTITYENEGCCNDPCSCGGSCGGTCPSMLPAQGDPCDSEVDGFPCLYDTSTPCGVVSVTATCNSGAWNVTPPPCVGTGDCTIYTASEACLSDPACRWLVPGCGMPTTVEGCYPATDCVEGTVCASGQSCLKIVFDPCWNGDCSVCSADAFVCTGPG